MLLLTSVSDRKAAFTLAQQKAPDTQWIAYIPVYGEDGAEAPVREFLTALDVENNYILYHPEGTYLF